MGFSGQGYWSGLPFPLQGIFLTQGSVLGLLHCGWILYQLSHQGMREMQIKTTMRYHLILIRMAIIQKLTNNQCWKGCGEKGILLYYCWECKLVQPLRKTIYSFLEKLKNELPYDSRILLLGIYWKNMKTLIQKDIWTPIFTAALFIIAKA